MAKLKMPGKICCKNHLCDFAFTLLIRFYVFGGFGPPVDIMWRFEVKVKFVQDAQFPSGWIDQLAYYDIGKESVYLNVC